MLSSAFESIHAVLSVGHLVVIITLLVVQRTTLQSWLDEFDTKVNASRLASITNTVDANQVEMQNEPSDQEEQH